jgi:hypothetical protein
MFDIHLYTSINPMHAMKIRDLKNLIQFILKLKLKYWITIRKDLEKLDKVNMFSIRLQMLQWFIY